MLRGGGEGRGCGHEREREREMERGYGGRNNLRKKRWINVFILVSCFPILAAGTRSGAVGVEQGGAQHTTVLSRNM